MRDYWVRLLCLSILGAVVLTALMAEWIEQSKRRGRMFAEEVWQSPDRQPVLFTDDAEPRMVQGHSYWVEFYYDPETGLRLSHTPRSRKSEFYAAYNDRIRELVATDRDRPRFRATHLLCPETLIGTLRSMGFAEISTFPSEVSQGIVVTGPGKFSRWGYTSYSAEDPRIESRLGGTIGFGEGDPIYVGRSDDEPGIVVVRSGMNLFLVFDEDGRFVARITTNEANLASQKVQL